ncbi:hypothetical protein R69746_07852 [Paraburkholderia aspalathi]|nr:hypothetical protein [Paraburkholderia aspalathi]CAE6861747.1 hypothetical protein R69746_07852 [Paraburkholderia aspalathi]CAE6867348.1 hypothetical protein R75465_08050 [Paraburkholderia aspalathi]
MKTGDSLSLTLIDGMPRERFRFDIVLLPNFTLTAFSGFVEMRRRKMTARIHGQINVGQLTSGIDVIGHPVSG